MNSVRKEKMNLFKSAMLLAVFTLLFSACTDDESVGRVEMEDPSIHDDDVYTQAKSADDYKNPKIEYGKMTDPRDGKVYRTIKVDSLEWMAENLNFSDSDLMPNIKKGNWCYNDNLAFCDVGGRLYTWTAAMDLPKERLKEGDWETRYHPQHWRGVCPEGWTIPTEEEFRDLLTRVWDDGSTVGQMLKSAKGWNRNGNGTDSIGFTALPFGFYGNGESYNAGFEGLFWTSQESSYTLEAFAVKFEFDQDDAIITDLNKSFGLSVRCVSDTTMIRKAIKDSIYKWNKLKEAEFLYDTADVVKGSFVDSRDNREYATIKIDDQTWMAENLDYKASDSVSACYAHEDSLCKIYGRLYTYVFARDSACPAGWHLPTNAEFQVLRERVGNSISGLTLKSKEYWYDGSNTNVNGVDLYGFRGLPGGKGRLGAEADSFFYRGEEAHFWENGDYETGSFTFALEADELYGGGEFLGLNELASVRCVLGEKPNFFYCPEDTLKYKKTTFYGTDSSQTQDGYMKDLRDGKYYRIVTIGKQTWMAENLNGEYGNYHLHEGCYYESQDTCDSLGVFYSWYDAMDMDGKYTQVEDYYCRHNEVRRGACPLGWHVPSEADWRELVETVGDPLSASIMLKSKSGWTNENGLDTYGFTVYASGNTPRDHFNAQKGEKAYFWTRDDISKSGGRAVVFGGDDYSVVEFIDAKKSMQMPVRCIKDSALLSEAVEIQKPEMSMVPPCKSAKKDSCVYGTVKDECGNSYKTVQVGTQTWMAENLKVDYEGAPKAGFYFWEMAIDSTGVFSDGAKGCRSYLNCNLVEPVRGICPEGWHLPSTKEWRLLAAVVGGPSKAWNVLKSSEGWKENAGVDAYGWNATPVGYWYNVDESIHNEGRVVHFWSWQNKGWGNDVAMGFYADSSQGLDISEVNDDVAVSVRCVKD